MTKDELSMVGFEIVAYSGDARSTLLELLKEMRAGNFDNVEEKLKEADENINLAHQSQTTILQQEARGEDSCSRWCCNKTATFHHRNTSFN